MGLRYGYNTNGLTGHRLDDAIDLLVETGYDGIALTPDVGHLDPFAPDAAARTAALARRLAAVGLGAVVETGARFLLDPRAKHEPTLVTPDADGRARRVDFLGRCVRIAGALGAECTSFWAGVPQPGVDRQEAWRWLVDGCRQVVALGEAEGVEVAMEPEPGMLVETIADQEALAAQVPGLRLALDVGHCLVTGEAEPHDAIRAHADRAATISLEDMRRGEHLHRPFGEGELDLDAAVAALVDVGYPRLVCLELSRDAHRAHEVVPASLAALRAAEARVG